MLGFLYKQQNANILISQPELESQVESSDSISEFQHICEFARISFRQVSKGVLDLHYNDGIEICHVHKGIYRWENEGVEHVLYPGDSFVSCPWQLHGSPRGIMDKGELSWLIIAPKSFSEKRPLVLGDWSRLSEKEALEIGNSIKQGGNCLPTSPHVGYVFEELKKELDNKALGYASRVNILLDEILIFVARYTQCSIQRRKVGADKIDKLAKQLNANLGLPWKNEEMAALVDLGLTRFNVFVKSHTGLSPTQFLTHLRIIQSKKLLQNTDRNITKIALDCGFYSSQHFATSFKKWTGLSPNQFRKESLGE